LLPLAKQRPEQISARISPPSQQSPFDNLMNALARTIERNPKSTLTASPTPPPRNVMAAVFAPAVEARLGAQKIVKGPTNGRKAELAKRVREPKSGKESQNLIRTPPKEALTGKDNEGENGEDLDEVGEENRGSQHPVHLCRKLVNTITMEEDAMRCVLAAKELEAAGKHDAAEQSYNRAMGLSKSSDVLAAYGLFVQNVRGDDGRAESLYKLSLKNNPAHLETLQNYAIFLEERRGDLNQAESLYATAVEATRNGFINELKTATTESSRARANNETGDARCLLHDTLPVLRSDTDYESAGSESGGSKRNRINDRKMSSKPASKTAGPRHSPQKEELGRSLRHASERRMPGIRCFLFTSFALLAIAFCMFSPLPLMCASFNFPA
jgi:tetratricopeptide (TPR) repeat protein